MNTVHNVAIANAAASRAAGFPDASRSSAESADDRRLHRERDFGIGYGNSSGYGNSNSTGYGLDKRYASEWRWSQFRFC